MRYHAFSGFRQLASGTLAEVYAAGRDAPDALIFDSDTGKLVDIDPRHPPGAETRGPGRPKLGVVAREITLLPRHWDWLATQPGGASVALRRLVEAARGDPKMRARVAKDAVYQLATTLLGNAPGYEEAIRALYAGQREDFLAHIEAWPGDVRALLETMAQKAFAPQ